MFHCIFKLESQELDYQILHTQDSNLIFEVFVYFKWRVDKIVQSTDFPSCKNSLLRNWVLDLW